MVSERIHLMLRAIGSVTAVALLWPMPFEEMSRASLTYRISCRNSLREWT
jgi:hypothetical protein